MESDKKPMEEIQVGEGDFFEADKFACNQEVFDLMKKLPNFKPADPTVPESGYLSGKPIYVHPACAPNTIMGLKNQKESVHEIAYMYPIGFQANPKTPTGFYEGTTTREAKDYKEIRVRNKPNTHKVIKALAEIISPIVLALLIVFAAIIFVILTI